MNLFLSILAGILGGFIAMLIPSAIDVDSLASPAEVRVFQVQLETAENEFFVSNETHGDHGIIEPFTIDLPPGMYRYRTNGIGGCCVFKEPEVSHCMSIGLNMFSSGEGRIRWDDEDPACTFYLEVSEYDDDGWSIHIWPEP